MSTFFCAWRKKMCDLTRGGAAPPPPAPPCKCGKYFYCKDFSQTASTKYAKRKKYSPVVISAFSWYNPIEEKQ